MKRSILEFGLAACIFTAANAVYGLDALISHSFEMDITELLGTNTAHRVPRPTTGKYDEDHLDQYLVCVDAAPGPPLCQPAKKP